MPKPLLGALYALLGTAGVGAISGAIWRFKECSATADAFTSAVIFAVLYVIIFGIPASLIGAVWGWAIGSRDRATRP